MLIVVEKKHFNAVKKQVAELNKLSVKKIHPIYQTLEEFKENVSKNKVVQNAIKGIVVTGEKEFILEVAQ